MLKKFVQGFAPGVIFCAGVHPPLNVSLVKHSKVVPFILYTYAFLL